LTINNEQLNIKPFRPLPTGNQKKAIWSTLGIGQRLHFGPEIGDKKIYFQKVLPECFSTLTFAIRS
jgi:hypothetical protein